MTGKAPVFLFADADPTWTRPARAELRRRGARVLTARTARDALRQAGLMPPDLIVVDGDLADPEVPDLAGELHSAHPHAEIVLLDRAPSTTPRGVGTGLLFRGVKPVAWETLLDVVVSAFPDRLERAPETGARSGTILCVDDDGLYLRSLSRLLSRHGYRVSAFDDPAPVLDSLEQVAPDVAILDVMMPGVNGLRLSEEIRDRYRNLIPVVLLTARGSEPAIAEGFRRGASYYVTKPCEPRTVLDIVDYLTSELDAGERGMLESEIRRHSREHQGDMV
ncbi:MAG: response regulator [Planctomycetes bacterium]|nr:response regulator [Planctomycetota bacterium]